jgi:hypothetical protein
VTSSAIVTPKNQRVILDQDIIPFVPVRGRKTTTVIGGGIVAAFPENHKPKRGIRRIRESYVGSTVKGITWRQGN